MDVRTEGKRLVKINAFYETIIDKLYGGAEIQYLPWDDVSDYNLNIEILENLNRLYKIVDIKNVELANPIEFRTYQVAHKVGFSFEQELEFLKTPTEKSRQNLMLSHLKKFIPVVYEAEEMKKRAKMNGHFKHVIPPY